MSTMREQFESSFPYTETQARWDGYRYDHNWVQSRWEGFQSGIIATEAAKATDAAAQDSAPAELPPLPEPEFQFSKGKSGFKYSGEPTFVADQMREYGQACAEAARQSLMQLFLDPENQPTQYGTVLAAQQPAPVAIKTWQERLREKSPETADRNLFAVGHLEHAMEAEIADLRAALAAAPASPQSVAKVLTAWEYSFIHEGTTSAAPMEVGPCITYDKKQAFGVGCIKQREVSILAASTPTTLTEKKE